MVKGAIISLCVSNSDVSYMPRYNGFVCTSCVPVTKKLSDIVARQVEGIKDTMLVRGKSFENKFIDQNPIQENRLSQRKSNS